MDPVLAFLNNPATNQVALGAVVTLVIYWVLTGFLVPRRVMEDRIKDKDARIAALEKDVGARQTERDAWHKAHDVSEQGRAVLKEQNGDLIRGQEIANRFMDSARTWFEMMPPRRKIEEE